MKNRFHLLERNSFTQLLSGNTLAMIIASVGGILVAQIYGPVAYGQYAAVFAIASVLSPILTLGREIEIPQIRENEISQKFVFNLAANSISIGLTLATPMILASVLIDNSTAKFVLISIGFAILLAMVLALFSILTQTNIRLEKYRILAVRGVFQNISLIFLQGIFSLVTKGYVGMVIGEIIGRLVGIAILSPKKIRKFPLRELTIRATVLRLRGSNPNWWNLSSQSLDNFTSSFLIIAFTYLYGSSSSGNIALTLKIVLLPIAIFGAPLGQMILARSSSQMRSGLQVSTKEFVNAIWKVTALGILCTFLVHFVVPNLSKLMGSSWESSSSYIKVLSLGIVVQLLWNSFGSLYSVARKWKNYALLKLINVLLMIVLVFVSKFFSLEIIECLWFYLAINSSIQLYGVFQTYKFTATQL